VDVRSSLLTFDIEADEYLLFLYPERLPSVLFMSVKWLNVTERSWDAFSWARSQFTGSETVSARCLASVPPLVVIGEIKLGCGLVSTKIYL